MSKVEIIGFDSHADQLKRREVGVLSGSLKVYNEKLVTIDDGINNLELSMASVDTLLAGSIGHTNNTTAMGDGSNQLRSVMLGYDRVNQKARSVLVDAAGRIECSVDALEVTAETINLNTDTLEAKLAAIEILEGTIAGDTTSLDGKVTACNTGAVVLAAGSAEIGTVALSATDNAVLDAMATDLAALEVLQGTIAGDTTSLDGKVTACNTGAVVLAAGSAAIGTVALSATDNAVLDAMATDLAALEVLQATIAGDTTSLDGKVTACNTGAVVLAAGSAAIGTVALSATDNAVLDAMATDLAALEVLQATIAGDTTSLDGKVTACNTGAVVLAAGSAEIGTVALSATDNAVLDAMVTDLAAIEVLQATIAGDTTSLDGKVTACNTGAVVLAAGSAAIGTVALSATDNAVLDAMASDLAANEVLLTAIDSDTNAIKTSTASCATDLAAIEVLQATIAGDTTSLDGKVTACNTGAVVLAAESAEIGTVALSATDNAVLDAMVTDLAAIEVLQGTIAGDTTSLDGKVTACDTGAVVLAAGSAAIGTVALSATDNAVLDAMATDLAANEVLLTAIDADTNAIKTSTAACATDLAAIEVLQATIAGDTTSLDGKVTACNTGAVVLAAGSAAIGTVALSATDNAVLDAMATDLAAIEVLQGTIAGDTTSLDGKVTACNTGAVVLAAGSAAIGTVALSATDNAVLDAMATDLAANEVLLTAIDADTNAIKTSTASCATDLAALEVLQTSTLAKIQPTRDVVTIFNNTSLASEATITSAEIDMLNFRHILMAGFSDEDEHSGNFTLQGATSSGGTYFELGSSLTGSYNSSKLFLEAKDLPVRYIKVVLTDTTPAISNIILYGFRLN